MLSSIWVATITGFIFSLQTWMIRFWATGVSATSISTPRSPRATITPSAASTISSRHSKASRFSILAITNAWASIDAKRFFNDATSWADLANDKLMKSISLRAAHRAFSTSSGRIEETDKDTPGRLIPCLDRIVPRTATTHRNRSLVLSITSSEMVPSASMTRSPMLTSSMSFE